MSGDASRTPGGCGLPPRPAVDPRIVAMVTSAVDRLWPRPPAVAAASDDDNPAHRAWRFSGRWWSRPLPVRRDRPWVG